MSASDMQTLKEAICSACGVSMSASDMQTLKMAIYSVFEGVSISAIDVQNNFYYPMHIFQ